MNRIDRVTAILIQLQSRKVVKAQDIADRFGISLRTVYRDIKTLEEAGIPLYGEAGIGYSIMDGYRLPPVMFTKEEATAFLTAEKLIEKMTDASTDESYKSAMYKVRAVLRSSEKDFLETLDNQIQVIKRSRKSLEDKPPALQTILKGIAGKQVLRIHYFAQHNQKNSEREVEPLGIFYLENYWHLIGWCRLRKDYRDFRVDRISSIRLSEEQFRNNHPSLEQYIEQRKKEKHDLVSVVLLVEKDTCHWLDEQKYFSGFISQQEKPEGVEMHFLTSSLEGFATWFMMFGDRAQIIEPEALREKVINMAESVMRKLQGEKVF
ncbi:YafY family transcriptional regulator [Nostoc ellipsosporum NOK]|jgi:predicted DNA-binding transcriptional regulator YafY|nr:YafY family transcriptional regulator [Nostoc ellipsosporum NOK]